MSDIRESLAEANSGKLLIQSVSMLMLAHDLRLQIGRVSRLTFLSSQ